MLCLLKYELLDVQLPYEPLFPSVNQMAGWSVSHNFLKRQVSYTFYASIGALVCILFPEHALHLARGEDRREGGPATRPRFKSEAFLIVCPSVSQFVITVISLRALFFFRPPVRYNCYIAQLFEAFCYNIYVSYLLEKCGWQGKIEVALLETVQIKPYSFYPSSHIQHGSASPGLLGEQRVYQCFHDKPDLNLGWLIDIRN